MRGGFIRFWSGLEELSFEASELENKEVTIDGAYVRQKLGEITKDMDTSNYIL